MTDASPTARPGPPRAIRSGQAPPLPDAWIEATILRLAAERGGGKSISPEDAARTLAAEAGDPAWQSLLTPVRRAAMRLAGAGRIDILRKGRAVPPAEARGVIRLRHRTADPDPAP